MLCVTGSCRGGEQGEPRDPASVMQNCCNFDSSSCWFLNKLH